MLRFLRSLLLVALALASLVACKGDGDDAPPASDAGAPDAPRGAGGDASRIGATVDCAVDSDAELEPNDTPEQANAFTALAFCGVLSTASDVDYATFTTPDGTKLGSFQAVINGKIDFDLSLGGKPIELGDTASYGAGTYLVKAYTSAGKPGSYRIRLRFDPQ